jgi:DNA-binding NtrC family response regulator
MRGPSGGGVSTPILVVGEDAPDRHRLADHLARSGYLIATAASGEEALESVEEARPRLVIADLHLPGMDGLALLRRLRALSPPVDVLLIADHGARHHAPEAMMAGASDCLVKPVEPERIEQVVGRCLRGRGPATRIGPSGVGPEPRARLIGRDPRILEIHELIASLAENRAPVLIRGETGTGKELIARAIHFRSIHADHPLVAVNCSALTETLLESELFGHVRGAFTGAVSDHRGRFELAGRGTIFLDEIGDISPSFQSKLLRVLEDREFYRVGGERTRKTEARVIAATHRSIERRIEAGEFREDLYYRLNVMEIWVPPLRDRRDDIPLIAEAFLARIGEELGSPARTLDEDALRALTAYDWPGNVRELENALTRAAITAREPVLRAHNLALGTRSRASEALPVPDDATLDDVVRAHVDRVLRRTGGNKRLAARRLGISRPRLDRLVTRHGLVVTKRDHGGNTS